MLPRLALLVWASVKLWLASRLWVSKMRWLASCLWVSIARWLAVVFRVSPLIGSLPDGGCLLSHGSLCADWISYPFWLATLPWGFPSRPWPAVPSWVSVRLWPALRRWITVALWLAFHLWLSIPRWPAIVFWVTTCPWHDACAPGSPRGKDPGSVDLPLSSMFSKSLPRTSLSYTA